MTAKGTADTDPTGMKAIETICHSLIENRAEAGMPPADTTGIIRSLFALHDLRAEAAFNAAMARAQGKIAPIIRSTTNPSTHSKYADLGAVIAGITPCYTEEGLSLSFSIGKIEAETVSVTCTLRHKDGHKVHYDGVFPLDSGGLKGNRNKTPIQSLGSTVSYARRYMLMCIANAPTFDDDDGNGVIVQNAAPPKQLISLDQRAQLQAKIDEVGADIEKFCGFLRVDALPDIAEVDFQGAMASLEKKARRQ